MNIPIFMYREKKLTDHDLNEVEDRLGFVIPADLREMYLRSNGGTPDPNNFLVDGYRFQLSEVFPIKHGNPDLTLEATYDRVKGDIPVGLLPFGGDGGGNFYCYRLAPPHMHSICCWEHEFYDNEEEAVTILAPSLEAFLSGLGPAPDEEHA